MYNLNSCTALKYVCLSIESKLTKIEIPKVLVFPLI